jgi:hypothetical protein
VGGIGGSKESFVSNRRVVFLEPARKDLERTGRFTVVDLEVDIEGMQ